MKLSEAYPSNYLKADDLMGRQVTVVIESCAMEDIGDDHRLVLRFQGKEKSLVANKTNATTIGDVYGDETDGWIGKRITLFPTKTMYGGKNVPCIRVSIPTVARPTPPQASPSETPENPDGSIKGDEPATRPATTGEYLASGSETSGDVLVGFIENVQVKSGKKKETGKDYTRWGISMEGDDRIFGSFDSAVGAAANLYYNNLTKVRLAFAANGKFWNVLTLEPVLPESDVNGSDQAPASKPAASPVGGDGWPL